VYNVASIITANAGEMAVGLYSGALVVGTGQSPCLFHDITTALTTGTSNSEPAFNYSFAAGPHKGGCILSRNSYSGYTLLGSAATTYTDVSTSVGFEAATLVPVSSISISGATPLSVELAWNNTTYAGGQLLGVLTVSLITSVTPDQDTNPLIVASNYTPWVVKTSGSSSGPSVTDVNIKQVAGSNVSSGPNLGVNIQQVLGSIASDYNSLPIKISQSGINVPVNVQQLLSTAVSASNAFPTVIENSSVNIPVNLTQLSSTAIGLSNPIPVVPLIDGNPSGAFSPEIISTNAPLPITIKSSLITVPVNNTQINGASISSTNAMPIDIEKVLNSVVSSGNPLPVTGGGGGGGGTLSNTPLTPIFVVSV
jgi:hypothetical protein